MSTFGSVALSVIAAAAVIAVLIVLLLLVRRKNDWAGDPKQPQQPDAPQQPPRSIDDSQRFREQNRPTDPPPPA